MTGLKCPFCHKRLQNDDLLCSCINEKCEESFDMVGTELLWQKVIDLKQEIDRTRKALEIAVDALKEQQRWLGIIRISMVSHLNNEKGTVFQPYDADPTVLNIGKAKVLLNNSLEQINKKEENNGK